MRPMAYTPRYAPDRFVTLPDRGQTLSYRDGNAHAGAQRIQVPAQRQSDRVYLRIILVA